LPSVLRPGEQDAINAAARAKYREDLERRRAEHKAHCHDRNCNAPHGVGYAGGGPEALVAPYVSAGYKAIALAVLDEAAKDLLAELEGVSLEARVACAKIVREVGNRL
jgi:hypothetical protein